jgi:hypothetical protein
MSSWLLATQLEYDDGSGQTATIFAASSGHAECARLLLDAGADKEATTKVHRVVLPRLRLGACVPGFGGI